VDHIRPVNCVFQTTLLTIGKFIKPLTLRSYQVLTPVNLMSSWKVWDIRTLSRWCFPVLTWQVNYGRKIRRPCGVQFYLATSSGFLTVTFTLDVKQAWQSRDLLLNSFRDFHLVDWKVCVLIRSILKESKGLNNYSSETPPCQSATWCTEIF
jgi:hypothetical protein